VKRSHALPLATAAIAVALGVAWLAQSAGDASPEAPAGSPDLAQRINGSATSDPWVAAMGRPRPGAVKDDGGDEFLTPGLRFRLEDLLLEAGEADTPAALKRKLAALVPRHFSASDSVRALALVERYVDCRVALGEIKAPADAGDPRALRSALDARRHVRERYFTAEEYRTLFAQDEELDRFTLARLEIERNTEMTAAQKAAALRDAERDLSEPQRTQRADAVAHMAVAAQTAALDAAGSSDQERYAQRSARYGDAAALQLAQLDREERDWQARLDAYAAASRTRNLPPEQLQQLREQLFTREEQLRVEAALALRQQPAVRQAQQ